MLQPWSLELNDARLMFRAVSAVPYLGIIHHGHAGLQVGTKPRVLLVQRVHLLIRLLQLFVLGLDLALQQQGGLPGRRQLPVQSLGYTTHSVPVHGHWYDEVRETA
jgi:hypothetical protein